MPEKMPEKMRPKPDRAVTSLNAIERLSLLDNRFIVTDR